MCIQLDEYKLSNSGTSGWSKTMVLVFCIWWIAYNTTYSSRRYMQWKDVEGKQCGILILLILFMLIYFYAFSSLLVCRFCWQRGFQYSNLPTSPCEVYCFKYQFLHWRLHLKKQTQKLFWIQYSPHPEIMSWLYIAIGRGHTQGEISTFSSKALCPSPKENCERRVCNSVLLLVPKLSTKVLSSRR